MKQFNMSFYMTYLARWPDYFHVAEGPGNRVMGYSKIVYLFVSVFVSSFSLFKDVNSWRLRLVLSFNLDESHY